MKKISKKTKRSSRSIQAFSVNCRGTLCHNGCAFATGTPSYEYARQHASNAYHSVPNI